MTAQSSVATLMQDATIEGTSKTGKRYTYKGITSAQIVARAKEALHACRILYWPEIERDVLINGNQYAIWMTGHFINVDDPSDRLSFSAWGSDTDNSGKGYMKALTNANKQVLAKALMMSTVEEEAAEDVRHEPEGFSEKVNEAQALGKQAIETWADAYKAALDGARSVADLKRIRAENAHMMRHDAVPQVTKDYFAEKIAALESALTAEPSG